MKPPKTITIRNQDFRIGFVSNFFAVNYYELKQEMLKAQQAYYDMTQAQDQLKENKITMEAAQKVVDDSRKIIEGIGTKDFFERRLDLVKEACEINDIAFDRRWWERRTSPEDLVNFLDAIYAYGSRTENGEEPHGEEKSKKGKASGSVGT